MSLLKETIELSKLYGVRPSKQRGQNFLIEEIIYDKIISTAKLKSDEVVLEVGPGLGFLTKRLASQVKKVIAVELDKKLADALENRLALDNITNVQIFKEDILNFSGQWAKEVKKISNDKLVVVANLPYSITSNFLRYFVGGNQINVLPQRLVLMLQKEVAQRITAHQGEMSLLALSIQLYTQAKVEFLVAKKNFWPVPEVDSAVISLERFDKWTKQLNNEEEKALWRLMRIGFSAKRKMLKANLANGYKMPVDKIFKYFNNLGIKPTARAQELSLNDWLKLLLFFS